MQVSSYISPKARKGESSLIDRRGIIALEPIARHEIVAIKGGHIVSAATLSALPEPMRGSDVQIADNFFLAAVDEDEYEPGDAFPESLGRAERGLRREHRAGGHAGHQRWRGADH